MPTYGYQCTQCKHQFQVFQAMKDAPLSECPQCEGLVKRLLYPVGVVFKGSGWYVNDSRKPEPSEEKAKTSDTSGATESGSAPASSDKAGSDAAAAPKSTTDTKSGD